MIECPTYRGASFIEVYCQSSVLLNKLARRTADEVSYHSLALLLECLAAGGVLLVECPVNRDLQVIKYPTYRTTHTYRKRLCELQSVSIGSTCADMICCSAANVALATVSSSRSSIFVVGNNALRHVCRCMPLVWALRCLPYRCPKI